MSKSIEDGRITALIPKLLHETERLRRDVAKLHGRIEPFDGEVSRPEPLVPEPMKTVEQVLDAIRVARESILSCEYHLNAIRAVMDSIEKDAISREEMKPHLIRPKGKTSG